MRSSAYVFFFVATLNIHSIVGVCIFKMCNRAGQSPNDGHLEDYIKEFLFATNSATPEGAGGRNTGLGGLMRTVATVKSRNCK